MRENVAEMNVNDQLIYLILVSQLSTIVTIHKNPVGILTKWRELEVTRDQLEGLAKYLSFSTATWRVFSATIRKFELFMPLMGRPRATANCNWCKLSRHRTACSCRNSLFVAAEYLAEPKTVEKRFFEGAQEFRAQSV